MVAPRVSKGTPCLRLTGELPPLHSTFYGALPEHLLTLWIRKCIGPRHAHGEIANTFRWPALGRSGISAAFDCALGPVAAIGGHPATSCAARAAASELHRS